MAKEIPIETPAGQFIVSAERYKELLKAEKWLEALEAGGVDNWDYYSESLKNAGCFDDDEDDEDF